MLEGGGFPPPPPICYTSREVLGNSVWPPHAWHQIGWWVHAPLFWTCRIQKKIKSHTRLKRWWGFTAAISETILLEIWKSHRLAVGCFSVNYLVPLISLTYRFVTKKMIGG